MVCDECNGSGLIGEVNPQICEKCNGTGHIEEEEKEELQPEPEEEEEESFLEQAGEESDLSSADE
jgi:DnaJ-class molecular chaperone